MHMNEEALTIVDLISNDRIYFILFFFKYCITQRAREKIPFCVLIYLVDKLFHSLSASSTAFILTFFVFFTCDNF